MGSKSSCGKRAEEHGGLGGRGGWREGVAYRCGGGPWPPAGLGPDQHDALSAGRLRRSQHKLCSRRRPPRGCGSHARPSPPVTHLPGPTPALARARRAALQPGQQVAIATPVIATQSTGTFMVSRSDRDHESTSRGTRTLSSDHRSCGKLPYGYRTATSIFVKCCMMYCL